MKNRNIEALNPEIFSRNSLIQHNSKKSTAAELLLSIPNNNKIQEETTNNIDYLNTHFPFIRVLVSWTIAGVGHQSSSLEVVRQLRYLGYKGHIQIIWERWDTEVDETKFSSLLSNFSEDMNQFPYSYDIRFHEDYKKQFLNECELSITGAHDHDILVPELAKSKVSIVLQPYQWIFENKTTRCIVFRKYSTKSKSYFYSRYIPSKLNSVLLGHHYNHTYFPPLLEKFIKNQIQENKNYLLVNNLINIINLTSAKCLHLQITYSLNGWKPYIILANLVSGIKKAQNDSSFSKKGVLIFVIEKFSKDDIEQLVSLIGDDIKVCDIGNLTPTDYPESGKIVICFSDRLPKKIYTLLLKASTLPPLFEGANNVNSILSMAKIKSSIAYMSHNLVNTKFPKTFEVTDRVQIRCCEVSDALNYESHIREYSERASSFIAQFIIDSFDENSLLNQYFFCIARQMLMPNHNLTAVGINELVRFFKKRKYENENEKSLSKNSNKKRLTFDAWVYNHQ